MSAKEIPSSVPTIEIFAQDDQNVRPIAMALDPDRTDRERLRLIVRAQINNEYPKMIFCNIGGVYDAIQSEEFSQASTTTGIARMAFVEGIVDVLKGPYTSDIIISDPPLRKT